MGLKSRNTPEATLPDAIRIDSELRLRHWRLEDAPALFALADRNRAYLREWMSWLDATQSVDDIRNFLQDSIDGYASGKSCRWALILNGEISGVIGLEAIQTLSNRAKIGYWQSQDLQGQGCITRAVQTLLGYAFRTRNLNLVEIRAADKNRKSRAVAVRVGMRFEGLLRQREWLYDHHVDHAIYSILASEWLATNK